MKMIFSRMKTIVRNINYLSKHSLWDQREEDIVYLSKKILDDGLYSYGLCEKKNSYPNILSVEDSLKIIESNPKSFIRTGDGEIKIIMGNNQPFQKYDKELAEVLKKILGNDNDDIYVGLNKMYYSQLTSEVNDFYYRFAFDYRAVYDKYIDYSSVYVDSMFTLYETNKNPDVAATRFERWKELFKDRDIVIVCGDHILDKLQYDIFERAKSKRFIYGPKRNAWENRNEILLNIYKSIPNTCLLVFILGMAGKAMIPELTAAGYMCWDVGHLAKAYNAYKVGMIWNEENTRKFYAPD